MVLFLHVCILPCFHSPMLSLIQTVSIAMDLYKISENYMYMYMYWVKGSSICTCRSVLLHTST